MVVQGLYDLCKSLPAKVKSPLDPYNERAQCWLAELRARVG